MEIILKQEVDNLGYKDQVVNVKPGYANNFLIPQGYAVAATPSAKKQHAEILKQRAHKEAKMVADAETLAAKLEKVVLTLTVKANESGKIFGAVTAADIADGLKAKGIELDKRAIKVPAIKEVGSHKATVRIYKEVNGTVALEVVATEAAAPAVEAAE